MEQAIKYKIHGTKGQEVWQPEDFDAQREKLLRRLEGCGVVSILPDGKLLLNENVVKKYELPPIVFDTKEIFEVLKNVNVFRMTSDHHLDEVPLLAIPPSLAIAQQNNFSEVCEISIYKPWNFDDKGADRSIELEDGSTTAFELFLFYCFSKQKFLRRNDESQLEMKIDNEWVPFTTYQFAQYHNVDSWFHDEQNRALSFENTPTMYLTRFAPNIISLGYISLSSDFERQGRSVDIGIYGATERHINSPNASFTGKGGVSIRYSIGRRDAKYFSGTEILNEDIKYFKQLSREIVGVYTEQGLTLTIQLLSESEAKQLREETRERLINGGMSTSVSNISANTKVSNTEFKQRLKAYNVADYLPQRKRESDDDYQARLEKYQDANQVFESLTGFFAEQRLPIFELPWDEQLVLAEVVDVMKQKRKGEWLRYFADRYGLVGVRTLLASSFGKGNIYTIEKVADELEETVAKEIFEKFNTIVDQAVEAAAIQTLDPADRIKVKDALLERAVRFLSGIDVSDPDAINERLEQFSEEIATLAAVSQAVGIEDIESLDIEVKNLADLTDEEKEDLLYLSREVLDKDQHHTKVLVDKLVEDLQSTYEKAGSGFNPEFHILKHQGKVVSFLYFADGSNDETVYATSFRMREEAQGAGLAVPFLDRTLKVKNKNFAIEAHAIGDLPIFSTYLKLGFQDDGPEHDYLGSGVTYRKLFMPKASQ